MKILLGPVGLGALLLAASCTTAPKPHPPLKTELPVAHARAASTRAADLAEARSFREARDFASADAIYQRCVAQNPGDGEVHFSYGISLSTEANACADAMAAVALRQRARRELMEAQRLGSQDPLIAMLLADLKPDGSPKPTPTFSKHAQANALMQSAEAAYAKGEFSQAAQLHQQALAIEPGNYVAALLCGDAYFSSHDYEKAGEWFAKAVAINPDIETAYRYWADALTRQKRYEQATDRFIHAVAVDPYNRLTRERFRQYCEAVGLAPRLTTLPLPSVPKKDTSGMRPIEIQVDPDGGTYALTLGVVYSGACLEVREKEFARLFPNETKPRRSLPEEVKGLRRALEEAQKFAAERPDAATAAEIARWRPSLDRLAQMDHDGLLEAFALLERADGELAQDFSAYRLAHREQLARFIRVYWCGLE